jgi:hypothetical protein
MSTTLNIPLTPSEIQDAVIDQLYADTKTLSNISLVSKRWLARARRWSFVHREAKIMSRSDMPDSFDEKRDAHRFVELLQAPHSTLAPHIQSVLILGPDIGHEASNPTGPQEDYDVLNALISKHLPLLCNVRTVTIYGVTWRCLRPESKAVIGSLQHATAVSWQSVSFESLPEMLGFCSANLSRLKTLKIRQIKVTVATPEPKDLCTPSSTGGSFPHLRFLDLVVESPLLPLLSAPSTYIQAQNIEVFCLARVSLDNIPLVGGLIEAAGPTLRHVALDIAEAATGAEASTTGAHLLLPMS